MKRHKYMIKNKMINRIYKMRYNIKLIKHNIAAAAPRPGWPAAPAAMLCFISFYVVC